jgi:hypothetical protein
VGLTGAALEADGVSGVTFLVLAVLVDGASMFSCIRYFGRDGVGSMGRRCGIDNTLPSYDVAPPLTKFPLLLRGLHLLCFRGGRFARSDVFGP